MLQCTSLDKREHVAEVACWSQPKLIDRHSDCCIEAASVMFTIEQINDVHDRLGSAKTFTDYVLALKALGVERAESYLFGRHSVYFAHHIN